MSDKCHCGKEAVGVIRTLFWHKYVCKQHAEEMELKGWVVDYYDEGGNIQ